MRTTKPIACLMLLSALLIGATGCRTLTGRSAGQWTDDKATTARVKTALAAQQVGSLTRIDVDTRDDVVYLTGVVDGQERIQQVLDVVRGVTEGKRIVNQLSVARAGRDTPGSARASTPLTTSVADMPRFARVELDPEAQAGDLPARMAAFDAAGKHVATIYALTGQQWRSPTYRDLPAARPVDHVAVYTQGGHYHVVLWHVGQAEAARVR